MTIRQFAWGLLFIAGAAQADLVVVVSSKSPVGKLEQGQVVDLFLGSSKELPGAGRATLLAMGPPTRDEFYAKVLGKDAAQMKALWSRLVFSGKGIAPKEFGNAADLRNAVAANANAVAFMNKADVDASVKIVFSP